MQEDGGTGTSGGRGCPLPLQPGLCLLDSSRPPLLLQPPPPLHFLPELTCCFSLSFSVCTC